MKIVVVCMQYDYGVKERGVSYEYVNFYEVLKSMGHEVILFDFYGEMQAVGKEKMNQNLHALIANVRPQLALFSLYTDEIHEDTVTKVRALTKTLCFFHDDTWRVSFSQFWASKFDYFTTPDVYGEYKYKQLGLDTAIHFPFGCNQQVFKKIELEKTIDVSFVGAWHPHRAWLVDGLIKAGFNVCTAGYRWARGSISHDEMVSIFNQSKINLNMSNSTSRDIDYLLSSPRALINTIRSPKTIEQLKARHFEISSCGAFQLSYYVEGLERQYEIGEEIAIYMDRHDLIKKVAFYLKNDSLREEIAQKALLKSEQSHRFEQRFEHAFMRMGLNDVG